MKIHRLNRVVQLVLAFAFCFSLCVKAQDQNNIDTARAREFRGGELAPGLYFRNRADSGHVTTEAPLVDLDRLERIRNLFEEHPELRSHRAVLSIPTFRAPETLRRIKRLLREHNLPADVQTVRNPQRLMEHLLHSVPGRIDFEGLSDQEIRECAQSMVGASFISIGLFSYLAAIGEISWGLVGVGALFDIFKSSTLFPMMRFWSNYFKRVSGAARVGASFLYNAVFSSGFYLILNSGEEITFWPPVISTVISVAALNTVFGVSVSSAVFLWEGAENNLLNRETRAVIRSRVFKYLQYLTAFLSLVALNPGTPAIFGMDSEYFTYNIGHALMTGFSFLAIGAWAKVGLIAEYTNRMADAKQGLIRDTLARMRRSRFASFCSRQMERISFLGASLRLRPRRPSN